MKKFRNSKIFFWWYCAFVFFLFITFYFQNWIFVGVVIGNFFYPFVCKKKTLKNSNDIGIGMQKCESFYFYGRPKKVTLWKLQNLFSICNSLRVTSNTNAATGFCVSFLWIFFFGKLKEEVAISHRQVCSKNLKVFSGFLFTSA